MNSSTLLIVLAVLMLALCAYQALKVFSIRRRKAASAAWPAAEGQVLSKGVSSVRNSKNGSYTYRAEVTYSYAAPGGPYEKKLFLGTKGLRTQADKLLEGVGETIPLRYNPEKPAEQFSDYEKVMPVQVVTIAVLFILAIVLAVLALI